MDGKAEGADGPRRIDVHRRVEPGAAERCPFCHDPVLLEAPTPWVACAACLARHHRTCWDESTRCGACGHAARLRPDARRRGFGLLVLAAGLGAFLTAVPVAVVARFRETIVVIDDTPPYDPGPPVFLEPPPVTPRVQGAADLSHVRVGQRYVFEMQNNMQQVWTVREVGADFVRYELSMVMGGNPLGDSTAQEWRYMPAPEAVPAATATDVKTSRETLIISGLVFDCLVTEASGYKAWSTMTPGSDVITTFPGIARCVQVSDDAVVMGLVRIE